MFIMIAAGFIFFAHITKSTFWQIMSGLVTIAAGVELVTRHTDTWSYLMFGVAIAAIGLYQLIMVSVDLWRGD